MKQYIILITSGAKLLLLIFKRYFNYDIKISLNILVFLRASHVVESKSCSLHSLTALVRLDTPLRPSRSLWKLHAAIMIGRPTELIALAINQQQRQHQIAAVQREPHQNLIDMCERKCMCTFCGESTMFPHYIYFYQLFKTGKMQ